MDAFVDERDFQLLEGDKYTFAVLRAIVGGKNMLLLSDHERLILCKAVDRFPAWIWTPDGASDEEMERAYALSASHGLLRSGQNVYMKYELADYWIRRAAADGLSLSISSNTCAYDCPSPVAPADKADGEMRLCVQSDLDELAELLDLFHIETRMDRKDADATRAEAASLISAGNTYFWQNSEGRTVACCSCRPEDGMASVSNVYTRQAYRRKHYAENLVYQVSAIAIEAGLEPALYADADYEASNACYQKIGYVLRGKLCTVEVG